MATGRMNWSVKIRLFNAVLLVVILTILLPRLGTIGAAIATLAVAVVGVLLMGRGAKRAGFQAGGRRYGLRPGGRAKRLREQFIPLPAGSVGAGARIEVRLCRVKKQVAGGRGR